MELSAQSFMKACREGGPLIATWLRVVDRQHGAALYREAAAILRSWQQAEDVVQDAMVKVWLRCATFHGPGDPMAWIRQIVRNAVIDALRARPPEQPLQTEDGELTAEAQAAVNTLSSHTGQTPEHALREREVEAVFRRCFARFAAAHPEHATVLRWVVEDGLDNRAVEELLGRSPGATREFISQCRKKARPFFADWYALVSPAGAPGAGRAAAPREP